VYFDLAHAYRRQAARDRVAEAMQKHHPQVLVAHSLGSVVAYETLCAYPQLRTELLVTLGSPLAMQGVVFDRLEPAPCYGRAARPPGVGQWTNLADVGDPVAVPRGGLLKFFDGVDEDTTDHIALFDPHTVKSYLASAILGTRLAPYMFPHYRD
jgi:pimeloyl-ACP methyl ester carboxylesterase